MFRAKITAAYERSSAGAVILKIDIMVRVLPIPIRFRQIERRTMSQTAFTGVVV